MYDSLTHLTTWILYIARIPLVLEVQVDQSRLIQAPSVLSLKIFSFPDDGVH
jgi:hypothetical protein